MAYSIIPRAEWGARPARKSQPVARSRRRTFVVHYDGTTPINRTGPSVPQIIQRYHMDTNGWRDGGYNFAIDQAGNIYAMRGWDEVGAHAGTAGNLEGIGVQVAIGGNQQPSQAALAALVWLKAEADRLCGRTLAWRNHGDYMATSCAGGPLRAWLAAGRPLKSTPPPAPPQPAPTPVLEEDPVPHFHEVTTTVHHPGPEGEDWRLVAERAFPPSPKAVRYMASARVSAPEGVRIKGRYVAWNDLAKRWDRFPIVDLPASGEISLPSRTVTPHTPIHLDLWADKPCTITVHQSTLFWEV